MPPATFPNNPATGSSPTGRPLRLRESHAHIASFGESLTLLDLSACPGLQACLEAIASRAREVSSADPRLHRDAWILAFGARVESWPEQRWPTRRELDQASCASHSRPGPPCVIMSFDHHSACANTRALSLANLHAGERVEPNGLVVTDSSNHATGVLLEHAAYCAWNAAPEPSHAQRSSQVRTALLALAAMGYIEVHDMLSQPWLGPILRELEHAGELPIERVWLYPPIDAFDPMPYNWESSRVRLAGAKLFADGTLNSRTALMLCDYREPLPHYPHGQAMVTPAQIEAALLKVSQSSSLNDHASARGHLAVHAIGDGAVRIVLDAIERVRPRPDSLGITARIEHCELIDAADVRRFASLGVVASVQPCHLLYDIEALARYIPHRRDRVLPLRELIEAGCHAGMQPASERLARRRADNPCGEIWFGSDVPIVRADPHDSIAAATGREHTIAALIRPPVNPAQSISEPLAWQCFAADFTGNDA